MVRVPRPAVGQPDGCEQGRPDGHEVCGSKGGTRGRDATKNDHDRITHRCFGAVRAGPPVDGDKFRFAPGGVP